MFLLLPPLHHAILKQDLSDRPTLAVLAMQFRALGARGAAWRGHLKLSFRRKPESMLPKRAAGPMDPGFRRGDDRPCGGAFACK
jgi:hypothetical protein